MANVIAEMPDELVLERLRLLVDLDTERQAGFPEAVLNAPRQPPT